MTREQLDVTLCAVLDGSVLQMDTCNTECSVVIYHTRLWNQHIAAASAGVLTQLISTHSTVRKKASCLGKTKNHDDQAL